MMIIMLLCGPEANEGAPNACRAQDAGVQAGRRKKKLGSVVVVPRLMHYNHALPLLFWPALLFNVVLFAAGVVALVMVLILPFTMKLGLLLQQDVEARHSPRQLLRPPESKGRSCIRACTTPIRG